MSGEQDAVVLKVEAMEKSFGPTRALAGVGLTLRRGEVHALLGGNGSGKSTFIKALAGVQPADAGVITAHGHQVEASSLTPAGARATGLRFVHQNNSTFPELSVAENLHIGDSLGTSVLGRVRWGRLHARTAEVLEHFHINASPAEQLASYGQATQAMVTIARALMDQDDHPDQAGHVLVLDEPTASLPATEASELLAALRRLADGGHTILYVTHRLNEVLEIADRATVFRDGRVAAELERSEMDHALLVETIMGRRVEAVLEDRRDHSSSAELLRVEGVAGGPLEDVTFSVRAGEVVGIAGVVGSGRSSLLRMLFGDLPVHGGSIVLGGDRLTLGSPRGAMAAGIALVPEDRGAEAVFAEMSVVENLGVSVTGDYYRGGRYAHRAERRDSRSLVQRFLIKTSAVSAPISALSGGNQQKVVLARWMRRDPRLLLLDEPTQGVDVAARAEIWTLVRQATAEGTAVLVVSSDFEELSRVCDRVLVLRGGRIADELTGPTLTENNVTHLALIDGVAP